MGCHSFCVNVLLHSEVSRCISRLDRAATWKKHVQEFYIGGHMTWMCGSHGENFWDFLSSQELKVSLMYVHRAGFSQTVSPLRCSGRGKGRVWRPGHTSLMQQQKKFPLHHASQIPRRQIDIQRQCVCLGLFLRTGAAVLWQQVAAGVIKAPGFASNILIRN